MNGYRTYTVRYPVYTERPALFNKLPSQEEADLAVPEEHFSWALRNMPSFGGSPMMLPPEFLRVWSKHLWEVGFRHTDYLRTLADEDGNIHVSKLPAQLVKLQQAFRGPHHPYNNAARWVSEDTPEPRPFVVPNIREMTIQEKHALAYQLEADGVRIPQATKPPMAAVIESDADKG